MRRLLALGLSAAVLMSGCQTSTATPTQAPTLTSASTATPAPTATPVPTPSQVATPVPTPTPTPTPTPYPTGIPGAMAFMKAYIDFQVAGDLPSAWAMLGHGMQANFGSLAAFTAMQTSVMPTMKKGYTLTPNPAAYMSLADWIAGQPFEAAIDKKNAVLLLVEWTALMGNNAGWEMWVVNPIPGAWELYQVR